MTGLLTPQCHRENRVPSQSGAMNNLDPLLTAQQLADYLDVPIATLYAWRYRREGPPGFRAGRHLRYRKSDIDQWINNRLRTGTTGIPGTAPENPSRAQQRPGQPSKRWLAGSPKHTNEGSSTPPTSDA